MLPWFYLVVAIVTMTSALAFGLRARRAPQEETTARKQMSRLAMILGTSALVPIVVALQYVGWLPDGVALGVFVILGLLVTLLILSAVF